MKDFNNLFITRTDLIDEKEEYLREKDSGNIRGILVREENIRGFQVQFMEVTDHHGEEISGKRIGKYITVDVGKIWSQDKKRFCDACFVISELIKSFIPDKNSSCMLAALGNKNIIADAIGPITAENYIVTSHIKKLRPDMFCELGMRETYCICPGVLGSTGIEAAQIIKGVSEYAKDCFVVAVDSLACRRLSRLATTVQICDTGITPGSGINNARREISQKTLGVPVIAIGVPTVVDVTTLASDIVKSTAERVKNEKYNCSAEKIINEIASMEAENFFVTPKETDHIIKDISKLIGFSLNLALHENLSFDEIDEFLS